MYSKIDRLGARKKKTKKRVEKESQIGNGKVYHCERRGLEKGKKLK